MNKCEQTGKIRYATPAEACNAKRGILRHATSARRVRGLVLGHYHCAACGSWHLGHSMRKRA